MKNDDGLEMIRELSDDGERLIPEDPTSRPIYISSALCYEFFVDRLPAEGPVVDLGCGDGYGVDILSGRFDMVVGADINERILRRAHGKYVARAARFAAMDIGRPALKEGAFGGVVSSGVIEHLRQPEQFLEDAWRLVRPGGAMIIITPNKDRDYDWKSGSSNVHHVKEFSAVEFERMVRGVCGECAEFEAMNCSEAFRRFLHDRRLGEGAVAAIVGRDRLNLRKLLPKGARRAAENLLRSLAGSVEKKAVIDASIISRDDFTFSTDFDNCLNLIAVCRKPSA